VLEDQYKRDENKVRGCQSTVWLVADYKDGRIYYKADSDAMIVKGLISMLIRVLSGQTPDNIVNAKLDFIREIGMMNHLAQTRSNGLLSMVKQMKNYALAFKVNKNWLLIMETDVLRDKVIDVIRSIYDPEIPVNIYDLGLIYRVDILPINNVQITMTLTAPSCPAAQSLPIEVDQRVRELQGVNDVHVQVTWDPPWDKSMMSEEAQLELGWL
jgi:cysteine desulfuration protein SufE